MYLLYSTFGELLEICVSFRNEANVVVSEDSSENFELKPMDFDRDQMRILKLFYAIW